MRHWRVAGGILSDERGLLLVANRRRDGSVDWSTPGGVIDEGETALGALGREVTEETGLSVSSWERRCWTVSVDFVELDMRLDVEVHRAAAFGGSVVLEDPDEIVTAAEFCDPASATDRLRTSPRWVQEPIAAWIAADWPDDRHFAYEARGTEVGRLTVAAVEPKQP